MLVITKLCRAIYLSLSLLLISLEHLSPNPNFVVQFVRKRVNAVAHCLHMYHGDLVPMFEFLRSCICDSVLECNAIRLVHFKKISKSCCPCDIKLLFNILK